MIGLQTQIVDRMQAVADAAKKAEFKNLGHAAASIRKTETESIKSVAGPSPPGTPPHTHTGGVSKAGKTRRGVLQRSFAYAVDKAAGRAVIGPQASVVGEAGAAHEFGGEFRGTDYPERSFATPALEKNLDRFTSDWQGSIGE
jgi:hypothetical protein